MGLCRITLALLVIVSGYLGQSFRTANFLNVVFYNVCEGGHDYLHNLQLFVEGQINAYPESTLIGLSELNQWTESSLNSWALDIKSDLHTAFLRTKTGYNIGAISTAPIRGVEMFANVSSIHHGFLKFYSHGKLFIVTHLNPHSSIRRREESRFIARVLKSTDNVSFVLGDLNTLSIKDKGSINSKILSKNARLRSKFFVGDIIDYSPLDILLLEGELFDSGQGPTVPTHVNKDLMHATNLRLDYILVSALHADQILQPSRSVVTEQTSWGMSDHYPVCLLFDNTWNGGDL